MTLLALVLGCATRAPSPSPDVVGPGAPAAADDLSTLVARLSVHHPSEDCDALTADFAAPAVTLRRAVIEVEKPPWVGMIAGKCLVRRHAVEEEATLIGWLGHADYAGLARVIARELPSVADEAVAVRLATAALRGTAADVATEALATDPRPALQALIPPR